LLDRAEQELKRQVFDAGTLRGQGHDHREPVERNRVNITISIDEGEVARIREIRFTGNHAFSDSQLRDQMELTTPAG